MFGTLLVGLGSALGGMARYGLAVLSVRLLGEAALWTATLFVNVSGSFVIGLFFTLTSPGGRWVISPDWRIFVTVGICGGYTTFSSFSLQTLAMLQKGQWNLAALNAAGSFVCCVGAAWLGALSASAWSARS